MRARFPTRPTPRPAATRAEVAPLRVAAFDAERAATAADLRAREEAEYRPLAEIARSHADEAWARLWAAIDGLS